MKEVDFAALDLNMYINSAMAELEKAEEIISIRYKGQGYDLMRSMIDGSRSAAKRTIPKMIQGSIHKLDAVKHECDWIARLAIEATAK